MKPMAYGVVAACILFVPAAGAVSAQTTAGQGSFSQAPQSSQPAQGTAELQLRAAHQELIEASRSNDKEAARRLMADELTWVNNEGKVTRREEMLAGTPTPPQEVNIERILLHGDTAIVLGSARLASGRQVRFLQEWLDRDGQWRLFAHQGTALPSSQGQSQAPPNPSATGTSGTSGMHASPPSLSTEDERAVWTAQNELQRAFLSGDTATYSKLTSDDFVRVAEDSNQQGKSQFIQNVKQNAGKSGGQLENGDVEIAVTGDTARLVMTRWGTLPGGEPLPPARVTRVFLKQNGQWQQAAAIFTPLKGQ
ncbi:MAG: nuclear transport factor 2 family protein [Acidobacteria bacterium]|nr:MAG: nuclear transport factor 2 family protein [Acidobacteriota bacterium]